jgi:membrane peptidoglycan carboxypeptidase
MDDDINNSEQQSEVSSTHVEAGRAVTNGHIQVVNPPARAARNTPIPLSAGEAKMFAERRVRVNRLIMRRRIHERYGHDNAPRIALVFAVILAVLLTFVSSGAGATYAYYQSQLPLLDNMAGHSLFQSTHIYDRNGKLLYTLYDHQDGYGRRTYVNYSQISPLLVNATIAAEDHTFWTNDGVDIQGILRAAYTDLAHQQALEGASTVTQQLIKNQLFDNNERTLPQKAEEALLAYGLTQRYPKWKIMEMYLNTVYYGDVNYGAEAAAQDFFNLQPKCTSTGCVPAVSQLDLAQASLLAGLPQSPSYYNPVINKPVALARQQYVLQSMVDLNMITQQQATQAEQETKNMDIKSYASMQGIQAPHFVQYVIDEVLVPLLGAQNLLDGGYNIYTTLDLNLEKQVEKIEYDNLYKEICNSYLGCFGPLSSVNNVNNAATVVMEPNTGEILAMDGSANYNDNRPQVQGQYNAAISPRQTGSAFKPIVYSTAFQMGWYPAMILPNHKTTYPSSGPPYYSPNDYGDVFLSGFPMTIRAALANSINIPAIDALEFAGIPNVVNMATRLGLTEIANAPKDTLGPSMALGTKEISLLHLTSAYATFANQGVRVPPTSILEITNSQGQVLYKYDTAHPQGVRAMSAGVAFLMSSVLSDKQARYHEFYPGNPLEQTFPAAAKTGTTDSFKDNWTMGYTPYLAVGVWAGNSNDSAMNNVIGITGAGYIWHDVMAYATNLYHFPPSDFAKPSDVQSGTVSAETGLLPGPGQSTVTDWFINGTMPTIGGSNYSYSCVQDCKPTPPQG